MRAKIVLVHTFHADPSHLCVEGELCETKRLILKNLPSLISFRSLIWLICMGVQTNRVIFQNV